MGQSLSTRITTRIELITKWLKGSIPPSLEKIPTTLNGWREYHNSELGISKIGSKTGFTTTDSDFGAQVLRLQGLITALNAKMGVEAKQASKAKKRQYTPEATRRRLAEHERDAALRDVKTVTGQWHLARHELEKSVNSLAKKVNEANGQRETILELHAQIREREDRIGYLLQRLRGAGLREV